MPSLSKAEQAAVEGPVARNVSRGPQRPCSRARTCARDARGQHRRATSSCPRCLSLRLVLGLQGQAQPAVGLQKALAHFLLTAARGCCKAHTWRPTPGSTTFWRCEVLVNGALQDMGTRH